MHVHGEADFLERFRPATVLDAGCGTGRVAAELARRGIDVVGIDRDPSMIATSRQLAPGVEFHVADVADVAVGRRFALIVMAGNVPLFTPEGTQAALVAGFQLGRGYTVGQYDGDCRAAGLEEEVRLATWDGDPFDPAGGYAVSVHRRPVGPGTTGSA